jgi:hypothetical protein
LTKIYAQVYSPFPGELEMSKDYWKEVERTAREQLDALRDRYTDLEEEREKIIEEMIRVEQLIKSVAPFTSDQLIDQPGLLNHVVVPAEMGLADACREVLKAHDRYLKPAEIRDILGLGGYDLSQYSNALASIHGVLKRMVESGEVLPAQGASGTLYKWNTSEFKHSPLKYVGQRNKDEQPEWWKRMMESTTPEELLRGRKKPDALKEAALKAARPVKVERKPKKD